ncbi:MAG: hypothetical protein AAGA18_04700 [Verrucomicrobiota bacterium]
MHHNTGHQLVFRVFRSWLVACFLIGCLSDIHAARYMYLRDHYDRNHGPNDVGMPPSFDTGSGILSANAYVVVVGEQDNPMDTGKAMKIFDSDQKEEVEWQYRFSMEKSLGTSNFRFSFDFRYTGEASGDGQLYVCAAQYMGSYRKDFARYAEGVLNADGWFAVDDSSKPLVDVSKGTHRMEMYVNDLEKSFTYLGPDEVQRTMDANSIHWFIDDEFTASDTLHPKATAGMVDNFGSAGFYSSVSGMGVSYVIDNIEIEDINAPDRDVEPATTELAKVGEDGRMQYGYYANHGQTNAVHRIPDWSRSGYSGGGVAIPFVQSVRTLAPSGKNDTQRIQDEIDLIAKLPLNAEGFRGALLLEKGEFVIDQTLNVNASGIVIRGSGQGIDGTTIRMSTAKQIEGVRFTSNNTRKVEHETRTQITDSLVPVRSGSMAVQDASVFEVGDQIIVYNNYNQKWLDDIYAPDKSTSDIPEENPPYGWSIDRYGETGFPNVIVGIEGDTLLLQTPTISPIEDQYGGGSVVRYTHNQVNQVGIENLRFTADYSYPLSHDMPWVAVSFNASRNFWARQVTGQYIGKTLVSVTGNCEFGTVQDSAMIDYRGIEEGGVRYGFYIDDSTHILFQRLYARNGRHDFIVGSTCPGPNVFVDSFSEHAFTDVGPHSRWSRGFLWDNLKVEILNIQNRESAGSGHGWAGAQHMVWNNEVQAMTVDAPAGSMNWSIGNYTKQTEGRVIESSPGIWESLNVPVSPRSLYYRQLRERMGWGALRKVMVPQQQSGRIWDELQEWGGEGRFLPGLTLFAVAEQTSNQSAQLDGIVRDLNLLERKPLMTWKKISGPGKIVFDNPNAQNPTITFDALGIYELLFKVRDGDKIYKSTVVLDLKDLRPSLPTGLVASGEINQVFLDWDDNEETFLESYSVYRSNESGGPFVLLEKDLKKSDYLDTNVEVDELYYYRVTATKLSEESAPSAVVSVSAISGIYEFIGQNGDDLNTDASWSSGRALTSGETGLIYNKVFRYTSSASVEEVQYILEGDSEMQFHSRPKINSVSIEFHDTARFDYDRSNMEFRLGDDSGSDVKLDYRSTATSKIRASAFYLGESGERSAHVKLLDGEWAVETPMYLENASSMELNGGDLTFTKPNASIEFDPGASINFSQGSGSVITFTQASSKREMDSAIEAGFFKIDGFIETHVDAFERKFENGVLTLSPSSTFRHHFVGPAGGDLNLPDNWSNRVAPKVGEVGRVHDVDVNFNDKSSVPGLTYIFTGNARMESGARPNIHSIVLDFRDKATFQYPRFLKEYRFGSGAGSDVQINYDSKGTSVVEASSFVLGKSDEASAMVNLKEGTWSLDTTLKLENNSFVNLSGGDLWLTAPNSQIEFESGTYINFDRSGDSEIRIKKAATDKKFLNELIKAGYFRIDGEVVTRLQPFSRSYSDGVFILSARSAYELWADTWSVDIGQVTEDFDGDSLSNLKEFALGGDPTDPGSVGFIPSIEPEAGSWRVSHPFRKASNLSYLLQSSNDLELWENVEWIPENIQSLNEDFDLYRYDHPGDLNAIFIRLKITK